MVKRTSQPGIRKRQREAVSKLLRGVDELPPAEETAALLIARGMSEQQVVASISLTRAQAVDVVGSVLARVRKAPDELAEEVREARQELHGRAKSKRKKQDRGGEDCAVDGCGELVKSRGVCMRHFQRWYRAGKPDLATFIRSGGGEWPPTYLEPKRINQGGPCMVERCGEPEDSDGLCDRHRRRWWLSGLPDRAEFARKEASRTAVEGPLSGDGGGGSTGGPEAVAGQTGEAAADSGQQEGSES